MSRFGLPPMRRATVRLALSQYSDPAQRSATIQTSLRRKPMVDASTSNPERCSDCCCSNVSDGHCARIRAVPGMNFTASLRESCFPPQDEDDDDRAKCAPSIAKLRKVAYLAPIARTFLNAGLFHHVLAAAMLGNSRMTARCGGVPWRAVIPPEPPPPVPPSAITLPPAAFTAACAFGAYSFPYA